MKISTTKGILLTLVYGALTFELLRNPGMMMERDTFTIFKIAFLSLLAGVLLVQGAQAVIRPATSRSRIFGGLLLLVTASFLVAMGFRFFSPR